MIKAYLDLPRPVHLLCLGTFVNRTGSFVILFLTLYLSTDLNLGDTFATRCMGVFGFGAIVASLVGGHLADQLGRRRVMLISLFGAAAVLIVFSMLRSRAAIMTAVLAFALIIEMYRPAAAAMIGDLVEPERRPAAFGLMYVAINLGFTCGAFVGGMIAAHSFQWLFWGDAATTAAYGLLILLFIAETQPRPATNEPTSEKGERAGSLAGTDGRTETSMSFRAGAAHIVRDWPFLLFCLSTLLVALVFIQGFSTLPLYMASRGFGADIFGPLVAINGLLIVCGQLPLTALLGRFNRMRIILIGGATIGVGYGLTALAGPLWQFALVVVIWTFGEMMQAPFNMAIVADLAPPALRARYQGLFGMSFSSALMIGAPIGGEILSRFGGRVLWTSAFFVTVAAVAIYAAISRPITARHPSASDLK